MVLENMKARGRDSKQKIASGLASPTGIVALAFIASRLLYYYLGIRFDTAILPYAVQFLDVNLLRDRLIESVFYLHCQPPLFNLFLGAVLKAFPDHFGIAFHLIYLGLGLTTAVSIMALMRRLMVNRAIPTLLTVIFVVSPASILYENWLYYSYPVVCALSVAALCLHIWLSERRFLFGLAFFSCLSGLVLTWSLFQFVWVASTCIIAIFYGRIRWQSLVAAAAIPLIITVGWHLKNWHYFGVFRTSSWIGLNLVQNTAPLLSPEQTQELVASGKLSKLALVGPFRKYDEYGQYLPEPPQTGVPALDKKTKDCSNGEPNNYNYIGYLTVSRLSLNDAIYVIKSKPYDLMRSVLRSFAVYLLPATDYPYVAENCGRISFVVTAYNTVFSGCLTNRRVRWFKCIGWLIAVSLGLSIGYGSYLALRWLRNRPKDGAFAGTVTFICLTIIYVTVVTTFLEAYENNRMRFIIEPYVLIMLAVFFENIRRGSPPGRDQESCHDK